MAIEKRPCHISVDGSRIGVRIRDHATAEIETINRYRMKPHETLSKAWHGNEHDLIAVGTQVTPRPPHRSVRAQLRHTAPTLGGDGKANAWPWVKDLGLEEKISG